MTIDAVIGEPSSMAVEVAGTSNTVHESRSTVSSKTGVLTTKREPGRRRSRTDDQYLWCRTIADQVREMSGGACRGPSPTTTVESELPPRIIPEYTPKSITCLPSRVAARASTWAASCTPWPPMPVSITSRSVPIRLPGNLPGGQPLDQKCPLHLAGGGGPRQALDDGEPPRVLVAGEAALAVLPE